MRQRYLVPLFLFGFAAAFLFANDLRAEHKEYWPETFTAPLVEPRTRLWLSFNSFELDEPNVFSRTQTGQAGGEYAFSENFSAFAAIPYTKRWYTNSETRVHIDNAPVGFRGMWTEDNVSVAGGLTANFASGNAKVNIGDKRIGTIEVYAAPGLRVGPFSGLFIVRWNTETNSKFQEEENRQYNRMWLVDLVLGMDLGVVHPVFEIERKMRYDPHDLRLNTTVLTVGLNIPVGSVLLGFGVPYSVSREREFDAGLVMRATVFL